MFLVKGITQYNIPKPKHTVVKGYEIFVNICRGSVKSITFPQR